MRKTVALSVFPLLILAVVAPSPALEPAGDCSEFDHFAAAKDLAVATTTATSCPGCPDPVAATHTQNFPGPVDSGRPAARQGEPATRPGDARTVPTVRYIPLPRGAPAGLVGGGTRGGGQRNYGVRALAPDHIALTTETKPTLFWFNARAITRHPVELIVSDSRGASDVDYSRPLVEMLVRPPIEPGVHCVRLSAHALAPGTVYEWSVSVVDDARTRALEPDQAIGAIRVAPRLEGLDDALARSPAPERPSLYGERGFWYDMLAALPKAVEAAPDDAALDAAIAALMAQWVGVPLQSRDFAGLECLDEELEVNPAVLEVAPAGLDVRP
jgi:hypothetical protein